LSTGLRDREEEEASKAGFGAGLRHGGDWVGLVEGLRDARDGVPSDVNTAMEVEGRPSQGKAKAKQTLFAVPLSLAAPLQQRFKLEERQG